VTRAVLLVAWSFLTLIAAAAAVLAAAVENWLWATVLAGLAIQWCMGIQLLIHGAQIERTNDFLGTWRRQDPEAWRRP
jgi:cell division protein FtsW (lipid II flippase)